MIGRAAVFAQVLSLLVLSGTGDVTRGWGSSAGGAYPDDTALAYRKYRGADEVGDRDHGGGGDRGGGGGGHGSGSGSQHGSGGGKDNQSSGGGGNTKGSGDKSNSNDGNDRFGN